MPDVIFDLSIIDAGGSYLISAAAPGVVGDLSPRPLRLPFDPAELPRRRRDAVEWVEQARVARLAGEQSFKRAQERGEALFNHLFAGEIGNAYRVARSRLAPGERLRLRLRLPPALATFPWELLFDPEADVRAFLALDPDVSLVRYPELPRPVTPLRLDGPLQVVAVLASPEDPSYSPINLDREQRRLEVALEQARRDGRAELTVIRGRGTMDRLIARLRQPVHVLHVLCHGELNDASGMGQLIFEDADGAKDPVEAGVLQLDLAEQRGNLRLVVLNACQGAVPAEQDPFGSVGAALLRAGVPAVIAMQFDLAEEAANDLTRYLYAGITDDKPVDVALNTVRRRIYARTRTALDWLVPVLYLRGDDGALFSAAQPAQRASTPPPSRSFTPAMLDQQWRQALSASFRGDWERAVMLLTEIAAADPGYRDVQARLAEARRQVELQAFYTDLVALKDDGDWQAVLGGLDDLERRAPGYTDRQNLRAWAEAQRRREVHYDAALAACECNDWQAAATELEALLAEAPDDGEAQQLLEHARAQIAAEDRQRQEEAEKQRRVAEAQKQREAEERKRREDEERKQQEARERQRRETEARQRYGVFHAQVQAGNYGRAIDHLETLLKQKADDREAVGLAAGLIENATVPLEQRLRAARLAGQYGDPRLGVSTLPAGLDDPYWAKEIPAGTYAIGRQRDPFNDQTFEPAQLQLAAFRIARYPVTVWQYKQFVMANGYQDQQWWTKQGWTWLQPGSPRYDWQEKGRITKPYRWDEPDWTADNQPVIGVSWYEAMAFCTWLHRQVKPPDGWEIGLPSEAEWEVAAMWDADARVMRAWQPLKNELWQNVKEAGIERTSPVGLFPQGISPCGSHDMAGNVWEWCASPYKSYPAQANQRPDNYPTDEIGPAVRGGSWYHENARSGWGARSRLLPGDRLNYWGFRLVVRSRFAR